VLTCDATPQMERVDGAASSPVETALRSVRVRPQVSDRRETQARHR
jgi:hypothetical protein